MIKSRFVVLFSFAALSLTACGPTAEPVSSKKSEEPIASKSEETKTDSSTEKPSSSSKEEEQTSSSKEEQQTSSASSTELSSSSESSRSDSYEQSVSSSSSSSVYSSSDTSIPDVLFDEDVWRYNSDYHWHPALDPDSEEKGSYGPHQWDEGTVIDPTYDDTGYTRYTCTVCGYYKNTDPTNKLVHHFAEEFTYDEHQHWHVCTDEGYEHLTTEKQDHVFGDTAVDLEATYDAAGKGHRDCLFCDYSEDVVLPKIEHSFSSEWSHDENKHWHVCTDAGYEDLIANEASHNWTSWELIQEESVSSPALEERKCTICGYSEQRDPDEYAASESLQRLTLELSSDKTHYSVTGFTGATSITTLIIPSSVRTTYGVIPVTEIRSNAVKNIQIGKLVIPSSVTSIVAGAFNGSKVSTLRYEATAVNNYLTSDCMGFDATTPVKVIIGDSVKTIPNYFLSGKKISSIEFGSNVTSIGNYSFGNKALAEVGSCVLPESLKSVGQNAFSDINPKACFEEGGVTYLGTKENKYFLAQSVIDGEGTLTINDQTKILADGLCAKKNYSAVILGKSVSVLPRLAFNLCANLSSFTIPDSVTTIGTNCFTASGLASIVIPEGVEKIESQAFRACKSLTTVDLPKSLASIGDGCFDGDIALKSLSFPKESKCESLGANALRDVALEQTSEVDGVLYHGSIENPYAIVIGFDLGEATSVEIQDGALICVDNATLKDNSNLTVATLPDTLFYLPEGFFKGCTSLASLDLPESITQIPDSLCSGCTGLVSVKLGTRVTSIGEYSFASAGFASVDLPEGLVTIGVSAFWNSKLTEIAIPDSVTTVNNNAFAYCSSLATLTVGKAVASFGETPFRKDSALKTLYWNARACAAQKNATEKPLFAEALNIETVYFGDTCVSIPADLFCAGTTGQTFNKYSALKNVHMSDSVEVIGAAAFHNCTGIERVKFGEGVKKVGTDAFYYCTAMKTLILNQGLEVVGSTAFGALNALETFVVGNPEMKSKAMGYRAYGSPKVKVYLLPDSRFSPDDNDLSWDGVKRVYSETEVKNGWHWDENGDPVSW